MKTTNELGPWGIFAEVWGGVTGRRSSWLKSNGVLKVFDSFEAADEHARHLEQQTNGNPYRTASFSYTPRRFYSDL
jgi:hypothetical protein